MASELYLTEYERERQKKIEENKRLLETLGIFETRSVLDASSLNVDVVKPKRNYIKRARVQLEPRRSERVSIRPQATSYAESDDSGTESDKPKPKGAGGIRKLNSYFSVRKTMWKPFYGQEIATCHICLVRNRQPKTKCSRCYADFWRGHVCRGCYEANFTSDDIESFDEARENPNWVCFVCRGICTCKFCRVGSTKRGKRYTKKRPIEEEEALLAQGQSLQIKEERDSDDGQFLPRKRGRGRPPKSRMSDPNQSLLMGSDPGDEEDQFDHPLFEGQLDHYHQLDQLEQLEQLQEQLNHLEQLDQLEQLERQEREQERLRQEQLALADPMHAQMAHTHQYTHPHAHSQIMPQIPLKRGRGRPPKNPQQQQYKRQKHEQLNKYQHKPRQSRHKAHEYSDVPDQDMKHDVQIKQEPLLDDSLLGHDPSMMHDHMMLHEHMLLLPEQPMLHEHILSDIPPLQEHSLQLPMLHNQSNFQDLSQDHGIQDQLFRDHTFQQPYHNSFLHHTNNHSHHTSSSTLSTAGYVSHDPFATHSTHFGGNHHGHHHTSANSILNNTAPSSLLLDNSLYQHPYFFQHLYYPQNQELQQPDMQQLHQQPQQHQQTIQHQQHAHHQQLQQMQDAQELQDLHRLDAHRTRSLLSRQDDGDQRHHSPLSHHHHSLSHHEFVNQEQPDERQDPSTHRDILHPASVLQDQSEEYQHENQDHFQSFQQQQGYEQHAHNSNNNDTLDMDRSNTYIVEQMHENDRPVTLLHPLSSLNGGLNGNLTLNGLHLNNLNNHHDMHEHLKQEQQHHEMQQREHYHDVTHDDRDDDHDDSPRD